MYGLIGKMTAAAGRREDLIAILIDGTANMPGCLSYIIAKDPGEADAIWITEAWDNESSHKASLSLPSVKQAIAKARPLIAGFSNRVVTTPVGGHGLPKDAALVAPAVSNAQSPPASERFRTLLDEDWKYWMSQYPEAATAFGYPGQDARWTDYSPGGHRGARRPICEARSRGSTPSIAASSPPADQLNYDLYRDLIATAVEGLDFGNDAMPMRGVIPHNLRMPINQMEGMQQDIPRIISLMPAATVADYENIVARLRAAPALDRSDDRADASRGWRRADAAADHDARRARAGRGADRRRPDDEPAARRVHERSGRRSPPADRDRLTQAAVGGVRGRRQAGVRAAARVPRQDVPAGVPRRRSAPTALPKGAAMYAYNVRWHTTTALTPKEIHEIGLAEVKRIRAEMDAIIAKVGFKGELRRRSSSSCAPIRRSSTRDAASLVAGYRDIAKRADPGAGAAVRHAAAHAVRRRARARRDRAVADDGVLRAGRARRPAGPATCTRTPTSSTRGRSGRWRR